MLIGYCIRRSGDAVPPADLRGVDAAPVEVVSGEHLAMWVSATAATKPTADRLREHDLVVRAALRSATPLPLRFGSAFRDANEVRRVLEARGSEFAEALDRLADHVEMSLRIEFPARPGPPIEDAGSRPAAPGSSGRAFLEQRRREIEGDAAARAAELSRIAEVERDLGDAAPLAVRSVLSRDPLVAGLAHLVHRPQLRRYRSGLVELRKRRPDLRITVTGPWAPYSFV